MRWLAKNYGYICYIVHPRRPNSKWHAVLGSISTTRYLFFYTFQKPKVYHCDRNFLTLSPGDFSNLNPNICQNNYAWQSHIAFPRTQNILWRAQNFRFRKILTERCAVLRVSSLGTNNNINQNCCPHIKRSSAFTIHPNTKEIILNVFATIWWK